MVGHIKWNLDCSLFGNCCCPDTFLDWKFRDIDLDIALTFVGCPHSSPLLQVVVDNSLWGDHMNITHINLLVDAFFLFVFVLWFVKANRLLLSSLRRVVESGSCFLQEVHHLIPTQGVRRRRNKKMIGCVSLLWLMKPLIAIFEFDFKLQVLAIWHGEGRR